MTGEHIEFVHTLYRQAALDRMGDERMTARRAIIADRLLASPTVDDLAPGLVIDICRRVGDERNRERLAPIALRAAEEAYAAGGWSRAADLYGFAVDCGAELAAPGLLKWGVARFRDHDITSVDILLRAADAAGSGRAMSRS